MAGTAPSWPPSPEQREDTRTRIASNYVNMAFTKGASIKDSEAAQTATSIERKAFTVASAEAETTTGARPAAETLKAYTRKLAALLIDAVKAAGMSLEAQTVQKTEDVQELDLTESEGEFLTQERAEEKLAPALVEGAQIVKLKFSNNSFIPAAAEVAARAIVNNAATLTHAVMSDIIAGRPEKDALQALVILSQALAAARLTALDLSGNALGEKGLRACADLWRRQPALEQLALQNVGLSIDACQALSELLLHPESLKVLHFRNNMTDDAGALALAQIVRQAQGLQELRLASSRVGPQGGVEIAAALSAGTSLVRLELMDNPLSPAVAGPLAALIRRQQLLRVLNLSDTGLTDEGVTQLADALEEGAPQLEVLELDLNEITEEGAAALYSALVTKQHLQRLSLRENELENVGARQIARALALCNALEALDLSANQLTDDGALAAAQAVAKKPRLAALELNENQISAKGISKLKHVMGIFQEVLQEHGKLDALGSLEDNEADDEASDDSMSEGASDLVKDDADSVDAVSIVPKASANAADSLADALADTHI